MSYIIVGDSTQEVTNKVFCCSSSCDKRFKCMVHYLNAPSNLRFSVIDYSTYGSGSITRNKVEITYDCGALGNYKRFIEKGSKLLN